jgi:DNA-binding CsgD family transcriptional regulator
MTDTPVTTGALTALATHLAMMGDPRAAEVAERALAGMAGRGRAWREAVRVLLVSERYERAARELEECVDLALRAELRLCVGDLPGALADAWVAGHPACVAEVLLERGATDEAAALLEQAPKSERVLLARGRLRLAQGRAGEAIDDLRGNPALLACALLERGETAEARRLAADELERARRFGAPRALGIALCTTARAEDDLELLREAVAVLEGSAARLELARALVQLGVALGRRIDAREPLRKALDLAHRCGATALEEHALSELRAAGARPRRRLVSGAGALTPSERRVAELAAAGRKNREIADALYLTLATVEYHLRNGYRKLGIASRSGLDAALEGC